jgi:hypothetical protein
MLLGVPAKALGIEVAEILGRGKAHRLDHHRHRAKAAGFEQLPGLVQALLAQLGRWRKAGQLAQPAVEGTLAQAQQVG